MGGGCTIWLVTYLNGRIVGLTAVVRTVCIVVGAGAAAPSAVGRLFATAAAPSAGAAALASAWYSSRSQLAAHAGLVFEREGSTNILVSGGEGRTAARQNVLVTTDYRTARRRWAAAYLKRADLLQGYQTGLSLYTDADKTFYHTHW